MGDQLPTAYERLGVRPGASASEITSAYRRLLRRVHPDSRAASQGMDGEVGSAQEDAADALAAIIEAYGMLRDPVRRAEYDRRQEAMQHRQITYGAPAEQNFLLRAGPVRWQQDPTPSRMVEQPIATEPEPMEQLVHFLGRRWLY
jgi:curved DNA-binding protein CbpA